MALLGGALPLAAASDLARGEEVVQAQCAICHGVDGESSTPVFPRLAGQHAAYIARQLGDFKSGRRRSDVMGALARELTPDEMKAAAAWFESRPPQAHPVPDNAAARRGRELYERGNAATGVPACRTCHGGQGEGTETLPRLGGQHAEYLVRQLRAFSRRERTNDNAVMQTIAAQIGDDDLRAVSAYLSGLK